MKAVVPDRVEAVDQRFARTVLEDWFRRNDQDPNLVTIRYRDITRINVDAQSALVLGAKVNGNKGRVSVVYTDFGERDYTLQRLL